MHTEVATKSLAHYDMSYDIVSHLLPNEALRVKVKLIFSICHSFWLEALRTTEIFIRLLCRSTNTTVNLWSDYDLPLLTYRATPMVIGLPARYIFVSRAVFH